MPIFTVRLMSKKSIAPSVFEFHFQKPEQWTFIPGQHINVILPSSPDLPPEHRARRFSPVDIAFDDPIIITTRILEPCSPFKRALLNLPLEQDLRISPAQGTFTLQHTAPERAVFIAGGIGITPFLSMLRDPVSASIPIHLFYCNASVDDALYASELQEYAEKRPLFSLTHLESKQLERPQDVFSLIEQALLNDPPWLDALFYLCGNPRMVNDGREFLSTQLEIDEARIHFEEFGGY